MTHRMAHKVGVRIKDIRCMASWVTDAGRDLLASIVVSAQTRLTFGFGLSVFGRKSHFTFGGTYGFGRI